MTNSTYTPSVHLFVDMDGTLVTWKQAACFEELLQNEDRESPRFQPWDERPIIMTFSGLIYIIEIWRCYVIKFMYR